MEGNDDTMMTQDGSPHPNAHRVVLEMADGIYARKLMHPEGGCQPVTICGECYRHVDDEQQQPCPYCPSADDECWVQGWFDNLTADEMLTGEVVLTVEPEWDGETMFLNVVGAEMPLPPHHGGPR